MTGLNDVAGISVICQQNQTKFNKFKINNVGNLLKNNLVSNGT